VADRLLVLAWHNVDRTWYYPCPPGAGIRGLARQLDRLCRFASIVPLRSALEALGDGRRLPPRAVALTFDDGYRDNLDLAVPLLERLQLPATFFLVPGMLSGEVRMWWEVMAWAFRRSRKHEVTWGGRLLPTGGQRGRRSVRWAVEELKALDQAGRDRMVAELLELLAPEGQPDDRSMLLDWHGARELVHKGFCIGSHSMYHTILSRESAEQQVQDLTAARRQLEMKLDTAVDLLAYPNGTRGDYDTSTIQAARAAGHSHAFTLRPGVNGRSTPHHELHRVVLEPAPGFPEIVVRRVTGKAVRMAQQRLASTGMARWT
jgi:peptidoglycan/xylan/chitin deacetylase (PgdA/CDA1 family)